MFKIMSKKKKKKKKKKIKNSHKNTFETSSVSSIPTVSLGNKNSTSLKNEEISKKTII